MSLWLPSHCVGRDRFNITFPPTPFTDPSYRSPASCSMSVGKRICYVRSRDIEEDDEEARSDRAKHTMITTTPATMAMITMIRAASRILNTKIMEHTEHIHEKMYFSLLNTEQEKDDFGRHMLKYINMWLPKCPFEVTTTSEYYNLTQEASTTARRPQTPYLPKRRDTWVVHVTEFITSDGLRGCHANHKLAPGDTVISDRVIYSRSLDTHNPHPIPGSSSSVPSCSHGEICYASLIRPLCLIMRYLAEQIIMLGIAVKHDPCVKDDTLNRREATNTTDMTRHPLITGPEPSGSELHEVKDFETQHISDIKYIVIDREATTKGQDALRTTTNSGSAYGPRDFKIRSLDHSIHTKRFEAHQEYFEHQVQMSYHATPTTPPLPPLYPPPHSSPISSNCLTSVGFKHCLPNSCSTQMTCSMQMMTSTQRPTSIEKRVDRQVHHKGDAHSKDHKIASSHEDNNLIRGREQGTLPPEPKFNEDERSNMMRPTSICVSQKSLVTTPRRSTSPTQYDPDNGQTALVIIHTGTKPVLCTTGPTHTKSSADIVEVALVQPSEEDKALSIRPGVPTSVLANTQQIDLTSSLFIASVTLLTGLWLQMICVYSALGSNTRFIE